MPTFGYIPFPFNCSCPSHPDPRSDPHSASHSIPCHGKQPHASLSESAPPPATCSLAKCATGSSRPSKHSTTDRDFLHVQAPEKPNECSICRLEFAIGQALGHRPTTDRKAEQRTGPVWSIRLAAKEREVIGFEFDAGAIA
ncbi:hypothetical protein RHSIM_Rhsim13G0001300 [Rhododendron simsii]|uniref:Uncharacterized protein n=1 Tax=Rhododendron simsii TaxID=118357 RepID=A0A834G0J6_RHOSS|nr:hypothetical protein RHSIM_Rhsim13G0001300 [Rhododendron simsii]